MRPKIVILSAFASPLRSGAEACAEEVPAALRDRYDFTIITARLRRDLPREDTLDGVRVVRVGSGNGFDKWLYPFLAPLAVRHEQPDIIHAVLETFAGLALHFCRWAYPGAKRMLTLQTTNRWLLKGPIIRSPHAVTAISSALVDIAKDRGREEVTRIPNGLRLKDMPVADKVPGRVVFVGRLESMKGIDVLLESVAQVHQRNNSAALECTIVGEGSERAELEKQAESLGITNLVHFVGFVPVPAVYCEFARAEIFCGLSRSEALGNVFLEAQAAGCAVIGTTVGGIPDIVEHERTGLLVPPNDADAAADALQRLLTDDEERERLAANGQQNAQKYDWQEIAEQYGNVYDQLAV